MKLKTVISTASEMQTKVETCELLNEALHDLAPGSRGIINQRTLAKKLSHYKNRIENGYRLEQAGTHQGTTLWRVKKIDTE